MAEAKSLIVQVTGISLAAPTPMVNAPGMLAQDAVQQRAMFTITLQPVNGARAGQAAGQGVISLVLDSTSGLEVGESYELSLKPAAKVQEEKTK